MELQFKKKICSCLNRVVCETQNMEQTQEIKLSEGMPDIGRVLSAWGQSIMRGKEWRSDSILFSGGLMVWVMYAPEDGTEPKTLEAWVPFQMKWDLPDNTPEGKISVSCLPRFVDARSVSPRKIMVRAGVSALGEAYAPLEGVLYEPESIPEDIALLRKNHLLHLPKEAGEKTFQMEESLTPQANPAQVVYYTLSPEVSDQKVLGNKIAFRGNANLHVLFEDGEGALESQDFPLSFSQFAELEDAYGSDAAVTVRPGITNLELELEDDGQLHMRSGLVAQYVVMDTEPVELVEDAYSTAREIRIEREPLGLPDYRDMRRETLYGEEPLPSGVSSPVDIHFLPDQPRQMQTEDGIYLEAPGTVQMLYYDEENQLQSASARWEGSASLKGNQSNQITVSPLAPPEPQVAFGGGGNVVREELPVEVSAVSMDGVEQISGLSLGDEIEPDPGRPSLIICRAGDRTLWEIAKSTGSTMEAIRKANGLETDPVPGQMLLIPVS